MDKGKCTPKELEVKEKKLEIFLTLLRGCVASCMKDFYIRENEHTNCVIYNLRVWCSSFLLVFLSKVQCILTLG